MFKAVENSCPKEREVRKYVAELILKVLKKELYSREALEKFPRDIKDDSLRCAWHALIHYEADEDFKKEDPEYADTQNNCLKELALTLQNGEPLPGNILKEYNNFYGIVINPETKSLLSKIKSIFRFIV